MKRNYFLILAAVVAFIFGLTMMMAPHTMLGNLTSETTPAVAMVMQWVGVGLFSIGCMNFISRNDPGGQALQGIMTGNIILHVLGMGFDIYDYSGGYFLMSGLITGAIVHTFFIIGFGYYLIKMKTSKSPTAGQAKNKQQG